MKKYLLLSLFFHSLLFVNFSKKNEQIDIIDFDVLPVQSKGAATHKTEIERAREESGNPDILKKKETLYYSYYARIASIAGEEWIIKVRRYLKDRKLSREAITELWVLLDSKGLVIDILLLSSSGDKILDDIAIESFKGKYFPNPPKDLIDEDGLIRILWRYIVYAN